MPSTSTRQGSHRRAGILFLLGVLAGLLGRRYKHEAAPRRYSTAVELREALSRFEDRFGMSSVAFYERYASGSLDAGVIMRSSANTWAGLYEEYRDLGVEPAEGDLARHVKSALAMP
jgi:hypothetical protein